MQKTLTSISASVGFLALFGILTLPASAQMCGGQQAQVSTPATGGMMCGAMGAAADDPMADKPAQKPQANGMCACCGKMAMMNGSTTGGSKEMPHMHMPGMQMK